MVTVKLMIEKALVFRDRVQSSHDNRFKLQTRDSLQKQQHKQTNKKKTQDKKKKIQEAKMSVL